MISYAQNFEDVMLWRALGHIRNGFYCDVGALSSEKDSVTKWMYDNGWHGINIEPNPVYAATLCKDRPRDITLAVAVSNECGQTTLFDSSAPGLSTLDINVVNRISSAEIEFTPIEVQATTLAKIFHDHVAEGQVINFLKIDVEGSERAVIEGNNWVKYRPWIIVIESTLPNSEIQSHQEWEPLVLANGYKHAYFDGLNRFYIAIEHPELMTAFHAPPNFFDGFKLASQHALETQVKELTEAVAQSHAKDATRQWLLELRKDLKADLEYQAKALKKQIAAQTALLRNDKTTIEELTKKIEQLNRDLADAHHWSQVHYDLLQNAREELSSIHKSPERFLLNSKIARIQHILRGQAGTEPSPQIGNSFAYRLYLEVASKPKVAKAINSLLSLVPPIRSRLKSHIEMQERQTLPHVSAGSSSRSTDIRFPTQTEIAIDALSLSDNREL
jgi:FkbM family methyltransferase